MDGNSVLDHIPGSYIQPWPYENNGSNSNTFELLLKNANNIASANRNLDASNNIASSNSMLTEFYPQASGADLQRCNIHSASDS